MAIFSQLLATFRWPVFIAVIASIVSALAGIGVITLVNRQLTANALATDELGLVIAGLLLLFVTGVSSQQLLTRLGHRVVYQLRKVLVKRILDTDLASLERMGSSPLYASLTKDISAIGNAFNQLPFVVYNSILLLSGLVYLLSLSHTLFMLTVAVLLVGGACALALVTSMRELMKIVRKTDDDIFEGYEGVIEGRYELQLNPRRQKRFYLNSVLPACAKARDTETRADFRGILARNISITLILALLYALFVLGELWSVPREVIVTYVLVLLFLRTPINDLMSQLPTVVQGRVSAQQLNTLSLADYQEAFHFPAAPKQVERGQPLINLRDIEYSYKHQNSGFHFALGPVDFDIRAGETVFIVGGNGSGKSTFAKLLTGLYTADSGKVFLAGKAIDDDNRAWYRGHFSAIFSDFHLFKELVGPEDDAEPTFDLTLAQAFLEQLKMDHKVSIDTHVLSSTKLSQGQRKRLALLLTYVEQRPIWLLDEWAADQDPQFRAFFYQSLIPSLKARGITIVAISHDDQYFDLADRVLKFEEGKIRTLQSHALAG